MADNNTAFVQQIFHISKRKRKPDVHQYCQVDDLGARLEIAKWGPFCHGSTLDICPTRLNLICSDTAQVDHVRAEFEAIATKDANE